MILPPAPNLNPQQQDNCGSMCFLWTTHRQQLYGNDTDHTWALFLPVTFKPAALGGCCYQISLFGFCFTVALLVCWVLTDAAEGFIRQCVSCEVEDLECTCVHKEVEAGRRKVALVKGVKLAKLLFRSSLFPVMITNPSSARQKRCTHPLPNSRTRTSCLCVVPGLTRSVRRCVGALYRETLSRTA